MPALILTLFGFVFSLVLSIILLTLLTLSFSCKYSISIASIDYLSVALGLLPFCFLCAMQCFVSLNFFLSSHFIISNDAYFLYIFLALWAHYIYINSGLDMIWNGLISFLGSHIINKATVWHFRSSVSPYSGFLVLDVPLVCCWTQLFLLTCCF